MGFQKLGEQLITGVIAFLEFDGLIGASISGVTEILLV